eukprot:scaffold49240_cov17-Tisochrysis_lutea.AAC.1
MPPKHAHLPIPKSTPMHPTAHMFLQANRRSTACAHIKHKKSRCNSAQILAVPQTCQDGVLQPFCSVQAGGTLPTHGWRSGFPKRHQEGRTQHLLAPHGRYVAALSQLSKPTIRCCHMDGV